MIESTASLSGPIDANGQLYQRRALAALPILTRQAAAGSPIFYSEIAAELGMPNPRNMNFVLGAVGTSMLQLSQAWGEPVPPIQALAINKATGLPGEGFAEFAPSPSAFRGASPQLKRRMLHGMLAHVFAYPRWDAVLSHFGIQAPAPPDLESLLPSSERRRLGGGGESESHRAFKELLARSPSLLGLSGRFEARIEYAFPSADTVDILFVASDERVAVEVKSHISDEADLLRGIFQCVKYRALLEAEIAVERTLCDARMLLALERKLPLHLKRIARTLGVEVLESLGS